MEDSVEDILEDLDLEELDLEEDSEPTDGTNEVEEV